MKMKKEEGFVSIETVVVAAIVVAIGIASYNVVFAGIFADKVNSSRLEVANNPVTAADFTPEVTTP
jgi:hypothetical protein